MITKLTLTIDIDVVKSAKKYAKMKEKSLSQLVESYLKSVAGQSADKNSMMLSPEVKKLKGSIKLPDDFDYKKSLSKAISKKQA